MDDKMVAELLRSQRKRSVTDSWKVTVEKEKYAEMFYEQVSIRVAAYVLRVAERIRLSQKVWDRYELDGIICPILATPALPNGWVSYPRVF